MPNLMQCDDLKDDLSAEARKELHNVIREQVIGAMGTPENLLKVQIRQLWPAHYRVNVLVGTNASSVQIAKSYFLVTDNDGTVITSTPRIAKSYW